MDKEILLAKIYNAALDPKDRCEFINELHKHPELTPQDYLKMLEDQDPLVRFVSAFFFVTRFQKNKPAEVIPVFQESLKNYNELATRFSQLSFDPIGMVWYLTRAFFFVEYYDRRAAYGALKDLLFGLETTVRFEYGLKAFLEQLFSLVFRDCEVPFADDYLLLLQRIADLKILETYADDRNVLEQFMNWGLPVYQTELLSLIDTLNNSDKADLELHKFMHGKHNYPPKEEHATIQVLNEILRKRKA